MRWPWRRPERHQEARATGVEGYTPLRLDEALRAATGARADSLAVVEAVAGMWERGLSAGRIVGAPAHLAGAVTPATLALAGRALLLRGEIVFLLEVEGGRVRLLPCSDWDVWGSASTWEYHVQVAGPSDNLARHVGADAVVHWRIGADHRSPWRGRSPLLRARLTATIAAEVEAAMARESRIPVGRLFPVQHLPNPDAQARLSKAIATGGVHGIAALPVDGANRAIPYGPGPDATALELRAVVLRELAAAAGVPSVLLNDKSDGTGAREAYRRFLFLTLAPVGESLLAELSAKLDLPAGARWDWSSLAAADLAARARAYGTFMGAGMSHEQAAAAAGVEA